MVTPFVSDQRHEQALWRFFDTAVTLVSDFPPVIDLFDRIYGRFRAPSMGSLNGCTLVECAVYTKADNPWKKPVLILGDDVQPLNMTQYWEGHICDQILFAALNKMHSHRLVHAGAVSLRDQGFILAGDAHHGKSTLTLELVRRGFQFLGDDLAALNRTDQCVYPFPKVLRFFPDALIRAGFPELVAEAPQWVNKRLVDIDDLHPGALGQPAPITHVIVLRAKAQPGAVDTDGLDHTFRLAMERCDPEMLEAIGKLGDARVLSVDMSPGFPMLTLYAKNRLATATAIETLCHEKEIRFLGAEVGSALRPSFAGPAVLRPMPTRLALLDLIRRLRGCPQSSELSNQSTQAARQVMIELAQTIGSAQCYELEVGPLADMVDMVCSLA